MITRKKHFKNNIDQYSKKWFTNIINFVHDLNDVKIFNKENIVNIVQLQSSYQTQKNQLNDVQSQFTIIQTQLLKIQIVQF